MRPAAAAGEEGGETALPSGDRVLKPFRQLYLHIPFCRHKCGYCDFNAYAGMRSWMEPYVEAMRRELAWAARRFEFAPLGSVYVGGGTPSLLETALMERLLEAVGETFQLEPGVEVTLEANPSSVDRERLRTWRESGVNRLSLGVQSFDQRSLGVLERRSDGRQAKAAFQAARAAGFDNISLDLIYAVPGQSLETWAATVEQAKALHPEHISAYSLTFEEGTLLTRRLREGRLQEVEEDQAWRMLDLAASRLAEAGYQRYEVSNFARAGRHSRHNLGYWECRPSYGAGAGAHSYATDGERAWRWWNLAHPKHYVAANDPVAGGEELSPEKAAAERLMLGLRHTFGVLPPPGFEEPLRRLYDAGLVDRSGELWLPTRRGLDLGNQVALAVL